MKESNKMCQWNCCAAVYWSLCSSNSIWLSRLPSRIWRKICWCHCSATTAVATITIPLIFTFISILNVIIQRVVLDVDWQHARYKMPWTFDDDADVTPKQWIGVLLFVRSFGFCSGGILIIIEQSHPHEHEQCSRIWYYLFSANSFAGNVEFGPHQTVTWASSA